MAYDITNNPVVDISKTARSIVDIPGFNIICDLANNGIFNDLRFIQHLKGCKQNHFGERS